MSIRRIRFCLLFWLTMTLVSAAFAGQMLGGDWVKEATLTASDGEAVDLFGAALAFSDDTVLIGASSAGIDGNFSQGAVYLFSRAAGGAWSEQTKLTASDGAESDAFGTSVALFGDTALVGAQGVNIDGNNNQGAAYLFTRDDGVWTEQARLVADDGAQFNQFGNAVALSEDTAVVAAIGADGFRGGAYVFTRNGEGWEQEAKLVASDGAGGDFFGGSIALSGDTVLIGAWQADVDGTGSQGAAYVFTRNDGVWSEQARLTAADGAANDNFGRSVALLDDTAVVGAIAGVGGNADQGAAYVFTRDGGTWSEQAKLTASDGAAEDHFGTAVALADDMLLVGATFADIDDNPDQGAVYLFTRDGDLWNEQAKLTAQEGEGGFFGDLVGAAVALAGNAALVGAPSANESKGAAYIFVDLPANVANISGTVNGLGYCGAEPTPLNAATITIVGAQNMYVVETGADGHYQVFLPDDESPALITVTAPDHLQASDSIEFTGGDEVVRDFDLERDAPCATFNPDEFALELEPGQSVAEALVLGNADGAAALDWTITAGAPRTPARVAAFPEPGRGGFDCDGASGLIIHDDGTIEQGYSGNPAFTGQILFADRFTPDSYPASFHTVCLAWVTFGPTTLDFEVVFFADDGPGGGPGTELGAIAATATDIPFDPIEVPEWTGVDVSPLGVTIASGSVFIGARWAPSTPNVFLAADESSGNPAGLAGGYRWSDDTDQWVPIQNAFFEYRAMFVRAAAGDPGCDDAGAVPWLDVDPVGGTVPAGDTGEVQVNLDATDLAPGQYRASLCVHSNDPVRPLHVVPVALTVAIPADYAIIEGTIEGLGYCGNEPAALPEAEIVIETQDGSFTLSPDGNGFYRTGVDPAQAPITITVSAAGHLSNTVAGIGLVAGETLVLDFELVWEAPCITAQPQRLEPTVPIDSSETFELTLGNFAGGAPLVWDMMAVLPQGTVVDCEAASGLLVHDDGTIENGYSENPGPAAFVDRFTPGVYPASFNTVCIAFITPGPTGQTSLDFEIVVYADDGPGGGPGTSLGVMEVSADDIPVIDPPIPPGLAPVWLAYDISSLDISIPSGSVYIGARWMRSNPGVYIAVDESPGNPVGFAGGYRWDSVGGAWSPIPQDPVFGFPNYRALFVRAAMDDPGCDQPGDVPWLTMTPTSGDTPAGEGAAVQVTIDTAALAEGEYSASLCVTSNDPRRPLIAVPVDLTVTGAIQTPVIAVDPQALSSTLRQGEAETQPLTISNPGQATLTWEAVSAAVFEQISAGGGHTCAIDAAGTAYCWGSNGSGQLGVGDTDERHVPTPVDASDLDGPVVRISAGGSTTCAVTAAGTAYCWGLNSNGQLGVDDTFQRLTPAEVVSGDMGQVIEIATGWQHTCAVDAGGDAFCWGSNFFGQLGNGEPPFEHHVPWPVDQTETGAIVHIAAYGAHTCAVNDQHAGFCWGTNGEGNLGDGTYEQRRTPTPLAESGLAAVAHFSLSPFHSCAVDTAGVPYCWGGNSFGQLGDGTTEGRTVPTAVVTDELGVVAQIWAGEVHTCAISTAGKAFCWGYNNYGQLGDGSGTDRHVPAPVHDNELDAFGLIAAGGAHTCAVVDTGTVYCWGDNGLGQLGNGGTESSPIPVPVDLGIEEDCMLPEWLNITPAGGSISAGGHQVADVTFDAVALSPGDFNANLCIVSNDPERPLVVIPLDFTVLEPQEPVDPIFSDRFEP